MIQSFIAAQLRKPSGFWGRFVMGNMLNKGNTGINTLAIDALTVQPADHVLEVGFGGGGALEMVAARTPQGRITGVDFSPEMVARAHRHFAAMISQGRAEFHEADVAKLPFDAQTFHKVLTVNTLYFWPDTLAGLRELWRVMKPGGKLVVAIRSEEKMAPQFFIKHGFRLFSPAALKMRLTEAGFSEIEILHADRDKPLDSLLAIASV